MSETTPDDDFLDGCDIEFGEEDLSGDDKAGIVMFADLVDAEGEGDPVAIEERRVAMVELGAALAERPDV